MLDVAQDLFNPSAKHTQEERERLEHTRVVEGDHGPGCGPVDLESGTVIVVPQQAEAVLPPRTRGEECDEEQPEEG